MSWLLFMDESGHDHRNMPYEVRGGFAMHASKLWPFIRGIQDLQQAIFGADLRQYDLEIKGSRLLKPRCFEFAAQGPDLDLATRRKLALGFLNDGKQRRRQKQEGFTAYGQTCLALAEGVIRLLQSHDAKVFAAVTPRDVKATTSAGEYLRKDMVFLIERFFYFLEQQRESGLLVMDGSDKTLDRKAVRCMERYFTLSQTGRFRSHWIVPVPLFVESDMAYGVQAADLCVYTINWGWRLKHMTEATRTEMEPFARLLEPAIWRGDGYRDGKVFRTYGTVYVPEPYGA